MFKKGDKVRRRKADRYGWNHGERVFTVRECGVVSNDIYFDEIPDMWYAPYFEIAEYTLEEKIAAAQATLTALQAEREIQDEKKLLLESVKVGDHYYLPADACVYVVTGNEDDGFVLVDVETGARRSTPNTNIQKVFGYIHAKEAYQKVAIKVDYTPLTV